MLQTLLHASADIGNLISNQVLPTRCYLCKSWQKHAARLCQGCLATLHWVAPRHCAFCSIELGSDHTTTYIKNNHTTYPTICGSCQQQTPPFSRSLIPFHYTPPISNMITKFKFGHDLLAGRTLAWLLQQHINCSPLARHWLQQVDALVPLPLHISRLRQRGFNQAHEVARHLARDNHISLLYSACKRIRATEVQSQLSRSARLQNCKGAFIANEKHVAGKIILLIDDVYTTGSTARAASHALKRAGAREVRLLMLARAS